MSTTRSYHNLQLDISSALRALKRQFLLRPSAIYLHFGLCCVLDNKYNIIDLIQVTNVNGKFVPALPMKGTVLVNIDDLMQRWTADIFKSVVCC